MSTFRKIDIDAYDEDRFLEEDELLTAQVTDEDGAPTAAIKANISNVQAQAMRTPAELESIIDNRQSEVRSLLNKGNVGLALSTVLNDPPSGRDPQTLREKNMKTVMDVLNAAKASEIPNLVKALSKEELDLLVKFIYKGMSQPELFNPTILLQWHEKAVEIGGNGCVVRVLTDRKGI